MQRQGEPAERVTWLRHLKCPASHRTWVARPWHGPLGLPKLRPAAPVAAGPSGCAGADEQAGDLGYRCAAGLDVAPGGARGLVPGPGHDQLERNLLVAGVDRSSSTDLFTVAREINPQVQGWINYYGGFYRSELRFLAWRINEHLTRWAMHKFKRFRGKYAKAMAWLQKVYQYKPGLFAHWQLVAFT